MAKQITTSAGFTVGDLITMPIKARGLRKWWRVLTFRPLTFEQIYTVTAVSSSNSFEIE